MVANIYLSPNASPAPLEGEALEDFFHDMIAGITALNPTLVRPRWQAVPPVIPPQGTVWIAFGFVDEDSDMYPWQGTVDTDGTYQFQRNEEFSVACSIYGTGAGSDAKATAKILRDGIMIPQNQAPLFCNGMGLIEVTAPKPAPTLTKELWLYRLDMDIRIRRNVTRNYGVPPIASVELQLNIQAEATEIERTVTVEQES